VRDGEEGSGVCISCGDEAFEEAGVIFHEADADELRNLVRTGLLELNRTAEGR
jgi:ribosomal 50S subunit-associated protein YjgA (DUF615 family)